MNLLVSILLLIFALCVLTFSILNITLFKCDNFQGDIYTTCKHLGDYRCLANINCQLYNLGGNRNQSIFCRQSGTPMGAFGNPNIIN